MGENMLKKLVTKYGEDFSWYMLDKNAKQKQVFENRLRIEIVPEHNLYSIKDNLIAIAKSERNDDVLLSDSHKYYIINLTCADGNSEYPKYKVIESSKILEYLEQDYLNI